MNNITIFGGCCSRDTFNFYNGVDFKISGYYARTSIISMMTPPSELTVDTSVVFSKFNQRLLDGDINKKNIGWIIESFRSGGFLLMDFIVERLDIFEVSPGSFVTVSSNFKKAFDVKTIPKENKINAFSKRRKELFINSWEEFYKKCEKLGLSDKILINKIFLTKKINNGEEFDENIHRRIEHINEQLSFIYEIIGRYIPESRFITYSEDLLIANKDHRWGCGPYHFIDDFYKYQKNKICEFY